MRKILKVSIVFLIISIAVFMIHCPETYAAYSVEKDDFSGKTIAKSIILFQPDSDSNINEPIEIKIEKMIMPNNVSTSTLTAIFQSKYEVSKMTVEIKFDNDVKKVFDLDSDYSKLHTGIHRETGLQTAIKGGLIERIKNLIQTSWYAKVRVSIITSDGRQLNGLYLVPHELFSEWILVINTPKS